MTSIPVSNAKSLVMDLAVQTPAKGREVGGKGCFTDVLSKQTEGNNVGQEANVQKDVNRISKSKNSIQDAKNHAAREKVKEVNEKTEDFVVKASDAGEEVVEQIANELGISEEEVLEAMEVLNLTVMDLLNPENLIPLLLEASGETDPMAILINGDFSQILKRLNQFLTDIRNELETTFELSSEELDKVLEETKQELPTDLQSTEEKQGPVILVENHSDKTEVDFQEEQGTKEQSNSNRQQNGETFAFTNLSKNVADAVASSRPMPFVPQPSTQQVMDQILEFMKIQIKPDTTQVEMQLHPESLGNVQVHLSTKEGVVTAQFAAQNESVKVILENQIIQLRESLTEQGVKVEAIEVSVQANGFRQEYEENNGEGNEETQERKKARRINLNDSLLNEMDDLSEEEQMQVSMMEANGNTVDYTA